MSLTMRNGIETSRMPRLTCTQKCRCGPLVKPVLPLIADLLADADALSDPHVDAVFLQVRVHAHAAVVVQDADQVGAFGEFLACWAGAVEARFHLHDHAAARGQDRRALADDQVDRVQVLLVGVARSRRRSPGRAASRCFRRIGRE